ncbi:hypothetical protein Tco_0694207, partial [Tanacetum coccineum]
MPFGGTADAGPEASTEGKGIQLAKGRDSPEGQPG